ncbi:MAG: hypothetical protein H7070_00010 [Saprospiraceae bacterium]|nr:hypothetical protein [Pyrinomonadaceae bacterium]
MQTQVAHFDDAGSGAFALDTTFVLFFLAVDFGQTSFSFGVDGIFSLATLIMLMVLPYFLTSSVEKPEFGSWIFGRMMIAVLAVILGVMFRQTLGVVLPETFKFLPLTLLIVAGMISCYIQFYGMMKFRLAR